ncbi:unnamed protein product, partial [Chrysoparadoxa australica]
CDDVESEAGNLRQFLRADYSILCEGGKYTAHKAYAAFMVVLYPMGFPLLYLYFLCKHGDEIKDYQEGENKVGKGLTGFIMSTVQGDDEGDELDPEEAKEGLTETLEEVQGYTESKEDPDFEVNPVDTEQETEVVIPTAPLELNTIKSTKFLWTSYRGDRYWWEVIECGRRIMQTGLLVFVFPGSALQPAVACVLAVSTILAERAFAPHKSLRDTCMYVLGSVTVFLSMYLSLLIRVDIAPERKQTQERF